VARPTSNAALVAKPKDLPALVEPLCYEHEQRPRGCTVMYGKEYYKAA
jgi:hypothetical protein